MKRVFISFAIEDVRIRDLLVGQARHDRTPFEFTDMSVKEPWSSEWKDRCRSRIRSCDGVIGLISRNTPNASGEIYEIECAYAERIPVMLMYINEDRPSLPSSFSGRRVNIWSWENINSFIESL